MGFGATGGGGLCGTGRKGAEASAAQQKDRTQLTLSLTGVEGACAGVLVFPPVAAGAAGVVLVLVLVLVEDIVDDCRCAAMNCELSEEWMMRNAALELCYIPSVKSRNTS